MNDMENIKKVLSEFEVEYDHNDWIKLEKDLPKSPGMSGLTKFLLVASAIIVTIAGVYVISQHLSKKKTTKDVTQNTSTEIDNNENLNETENSTEIVQNNNSVNYVNNDNNIESEFITDTIKNDEKDIVNENIHPDPINEHKVINNLINDIEEVNNTENTVQIPDITNVTFKIDVIEHCIPSKIVFTAENVPKNCEIVWNTGENQILYGNIVEYSYRETGLFIPSVSIVFNNFVLKRTELDEIIINQPTVIKINFENSENLYYFTCNNKEELSFLWTIDNQQFSENEIRYEFNIAGEHLIMLSVENEFGCKTVTTESVNIVIEHVFYVPNAFIPTSNGINSEFGPIGENMDFASYKMVIVDGNGNSVFESTSPEFMWNGKINNIGTEAKPGFYLWEIITMDKYGNVQTKKGRVNLIRN